MDFEHSERAQDYIAQVERFVRERVVPNEQTYIDQLAHTDDWRQWRIPPILDALKAQAKAAGLWNLFLPDSEYGAGLDNRDYAPLAEITGRSFMAPKSSIAVPPTPATPRCSCATAPRNRRSVGSSRCSTVRSVPASP